MCLLEEHKTKSDSKNTHLLTHWSNLVGNFFQLVMSELMDGTPTNNQQMNIDIF